MEKTKKIMGAQVYPPTPNNVMPECIKVCKVYDWTILSSAGWQGVTIASGLGNACVDAIDAAIADPAQEVTIRCEVGVTPTPAFRPCGTSTPTEDCGVCSATVVRQGVTVGASTQAAVVKLMQAIPVTLTVLVNGDPLTACPPVNTTVLISESTVLCLPVPLTKDNISCRVFDIQCDTSCIIANGDARIVNVDLNLCKDVRVETEVILEVNAKFCQPRLPITPPSTTCPIAVPFPPQCPSFFPEPNATVQANVLATTDNVTVTDPTVVLAQSFPATGTATINAMIAPNCVVDQSSLLFSFKEDAYPPVDGDDDSFNFQATQFDSVVGDTMNVTVTGQGTVTPAVGGLIQNVNFTLLIMKVGMVCSYTLTLTGGFNATITVTTVEDPALCSKIIIQDCITLGEV